MASVMTQLPTDFANTMGHFPRQLRAPLPINLPSRRAERDAAGENFEETPRVWTTFTFRAKAKPTTKKADPVESPVTPTAPTTKKADPVESPVTPTTPTAPTAEPPIEPSRASTKTCSKCQTRKDKECFSKKQWSAGKGRKCIGCTEPPKPAKPSEPPKPIECRDSSTDRVEPQRPEPVDETHWDVMRANNIAKYEEEQGLLRLAAARSARKPAPRRPPAPTQPTTSSIVPSQPRIRHKICQTAKKGYRCKIGDACEGAHSIQEYAPPPCSWGAKCRHVKLTPDGLVNTSERPCTFIHPDETQEHYHKRSGRHAPRFWTR